MIEKTLSISNKLGLHARAASVFVKTASAFGAEVEVACREKSANGKSIMSMMMLQAAKGAEIMITIDGEDESEAMAAIEALVNNRFGESE